MENKNQPGVIVRVFEVFDLIGATFAVIPGFETVDCDCEFECIVLSRRGTVSSDDETDFVFCAVYDANLICRKIYKIKKSNILLINF